MAALWIDRGAKEATAGVQAVDLVDMKVNISQS
jgi:hypothetical protein